MIPSGEQIILEHRTQRAVVVEVGGGLRRYSVGDWDLLDSYAEDALCTSARGQPLIPWPNRLRDGAYHFDGTEHQLALSEPEKHNAIHGLVRWANWTPSDRAADRVTMRHVLHPQSGWPFALELAIEYVLGGAGLSVRTTATNAGEAPCPAGAGMHPYLSAGAGTIDAATLRAPGRRHLPTDDQSIPTGEASPVDGTPYDFAPHGASPTRSWTRATAISTAIRTGWPGSSSPPRAAAPACGWTPATATSCSSRGTRCPIRLGAAAASVSSR